MTNKRDFIILWAMLFGSGEILVTLTSFLFGNAWATYWVVGQFVMLAVTGMMAGLMFASKYRDE